MKYNKVEASFTKFVKGDNWVKGKVGHLVFEAKLFDVGSTFGINDGRVSKLAIWDESVRQKESNFFNACIMNYDRGWDFKPNKENKPYYESVMHLLENAPTLFS